MPSRAFSLLRRQRQRNAKLRRDLRDLLARLPGRDLPPAGIVVVTTPLHG